MYRIPRPADDDDTPRDAGALGVWHEVNQLSDLKSFYQWEDLRAASDEGRAA